MLRDLPGYLLTSTALLFPSWTLFREADKYITIQGETYGAILRGDKGAGSKRLFSVGHSYYRLDHFTIDGKVKDDYYFDKCLYVQTKGKKASEIHFNGHSFRFVET